MDQNKAPTGDFLVSSLKDVNSANLFTQGCDAFEHVPGIKTQYFKGIALTLLLAAGLFYLQFVFIYDVYVINHVESFVTKVSGWWSLLGYVTTPLLWIVKILLWVIMFFIAMKVALVCMAFWLDTIIEKVIAHHRDIPKSPFSLGHFIKNTARSLILTGKSLMSAIFFLILSFIPIIGIAFGFIGVACSSGFDILSPYVLVLSEHDDQILKRFQLDKWQTLKVGWMQAALAFLPIIGWLIIPFIMLLQVIGYANYIESSWKKSQQETT
jgi:uncharacterized protein involved in cysteine biosynthesis